MLEKAACTIITKNYLAYARALAMSLSEHNPDVPLYVLLADRVDGYFDPTSEPFKMIYLEDLFDQEAVEKMCFYYTPFELCCALRGLLHQYMFDQGIAQRWLFLDSDIMVFSSLEPIFKQLKNSSILLTPHSSIPAEENYINPHETNLLKSGLYNAGFLGINRDDEAIKFIHWFKKRLIFLCLHDQKSGLFVDQKWLDLVPLYFDNFALCQHSGANLGHWNIFERIIEKDDDNNIMANGKPILFIHFSGWSLENPDFLSTHSQVICQNKTIPFWSDLANSYRDLLLQSEYIRFKDYPYAFDQFDNGDRILPEMRRIYHESVLTNSEPEGSPFSNQSYFKSNILKKRLHENFSFAKKMLKDFFKGLFRICG
jgi:lipopolysaccharide biosynthesis glycosyltransferase